MKCLLDAMLTDVNITEPKEIVNYVTNMTIEET